MPRKKLIRTSDYPYHVTIRCNNKEWFDLPLEEVWDICLYAIRHACSIHPIHLQAFVLMSNHYHMLIWTPDENLDKFMFELNRKISSAIRWRTGRINRIFGARYRWSLIQEQRYWVNVLRYIYENPFKEEIVDRCEDYQFSSLYYVVRKKEFSIPLFEPIMGELDLFLDWINKGMSISERVCYGKAVRKASFKILIKNSDRRKIVLPDRFC